MTTTTNVFLVTNITSSSSSSCTRRNIRFTEERPPVERSVYTLMVFLSAVFTSIFDANEYSLVGPENASFVSLSPFHTMLPPRPPFYGRVRGTRINYAFRIRWRHHIGVGKHYDLGKITKHMCTRPLEKF